MAKEAGGTQSVERALKLLSAFTHGRPELRAAEIARQSGLGQSTVSRLLATLESLGYVQRDKDSGLYRLGHDLLTLAGIALNQSPVYREARQIAQDLAALLGLRITVAKRRDDKIFYLLHFAGRLAPRSLTLLGQTNPLHATGLGKCLISEMPPSEVETLLPDLPPFTPHTITEHGVLLETLAEVRQQGYAREVEELAFGRGCVASAIRDHTGEIVAALSISGPLSALDLGSREAELASAAIEAADQISLNLGYVAAPSARKVRR